MEHTFNRDQSSNGLTNTDREGLAAYLKTRERLSKIEYLEQDINTVKSELREIRLLLQQLVTSK